jgi:hypothetical protein
MGDAKDIVLRPIPAQEANALVKRVHYSGKVVQNSQLHIGVFYRGKLEGAMQFGPSLDKRKIQGLVADTEWHEFIELNRLAFTDELPRNSESRALAISMRLMRRFAPQVKWVVTFADGAQCGDGTIYRGAGFVLTGIKENGQILDWHGKLIAKKTLDNLNYPRPNGKYYSRVLLETGQARAIAGFQLRYIYFIDPTYRARLTVPELPYSEIERRGAGMYKGIPRGQGETDNAPLSKVETGGARPTCPLCEVA